MAQCHLHRHAPVDPVRQLFRAGSVSALLRAKRPELDPLVAELRELTDGRHDIRTERAGIIAGAWFAKPIIMGENLIAAGLLINAGPTDMDLLSKDSVVVM